jgi:hypothetical protein
MTMGYDLLTRGGILADGTGAPPRGADPGMRVAHLLHHSHTVISLSDAGAHQALPCESRNCSTLLGKWVRERGVLARKEAVRRLTRARPPEKVHDMPAGEPRFISRLDGIRAVMVDGSMLPEDGQPAAPRRCPPRLLRSF